MFESILIILGIMLFFALVLSPFYFFRKKNKTTNQNHSFFYGIEWVIGFIFSAVFVGGGTILLLSTLDKLELAGKLTFPDWFAVSIAFLIVGIFLAIWRYLSNFFGKRIFKKYGRR